MHRNYGNSCHLQDIDSIIMWIESTKGELAALAEFKQDYESIELWKYKPIIALANNSNIPAYIVVGYQKPNIFYYIIPLNDICKALPTLDKPRFLSEKGYVQFLHYIRKLKVDETVLEGKAATVPKDAPLPNIKG